MIRELKAEFKKVFTIRSTYTILGLMLVLVLLVGFYVGGWDVTKSDLHDPMRLFTVGQQSIDFLAMITSLIGVLLLTHEFRYNTAAYSLTFSNNRSKVLASKIIVISALAIVVTAFIGVLTPLLADWGVHAHHLKLVHQTFYFRDLAWKGLVYGWGYSMAGLVIATLIRNQIGAVITLLLLPGTIEGILSIWLKNNTVYLPFSALHAMLGAGEDVNKVTISPIHAMYVFLGYLVVSWIVAWYLYLKLDVG